MNETILCESCRKRVKYEIKEKRFHEIIKGIEVTYIGKEATCESCGEPVYIGEINDRNLEALNIAYKEAKKEQLRLLIDSICTKYSIGKKPLANILGWSESTILRYYNGEQLPLSAYLETLNEILENPHIFKEKLEKNKSAISSVAYDKSSAALKSILTNMTVSQKKIDEVTKYLLLKCKDITPLALQKLLYYAQSFNKVFSNTFLFKDDCEAWIHGPVYRNTYEQYKKYGYNIIDDITLKDDGFPSLTVSEKEVLDYTVLYFGCYSGKILENMTHIEFPWLNTRGDLKEDEHCDKIIEKDLIEEYFLSIKEKFQMINPSDLKDYSTDLFKKVCQ